MRYLFFLLPCLFSAAPAALAQTVIYTTAQHPVSPPEPDVLVQVLEDINRLEQSLFPVLSDNPVQAEQQIRLQMQQPDWREHEARLTRAYQTLLDAQAIGITKTPAIVFDDKFVVYGTTDIRLAQKRLEAWREQQP